MDVKMNYCAILLLIIIISIDIVTGMTRPQLKKTLTIMKNQCMPKHRVTDEKVGQIERGVFVEDHDVMCYIACVYKTAQVVKNKRLDKDLVSKQIDVLYPAEIREAVKLSTVKCIPVQYNYEDECEGIFYSVKCLYEDNPANFIFP